MLSRLDDLKQRHGVLAAFFVVYYVAFLGYGALRGNPQTAFYALFIGAGALLIASLDGRARLSNVVLWALALWGFAHMLGGLVELGDEVIYERSLGASEFRFDKIVHLFGFGSATLVAYELLRATIVPGAPARSVALTAALFDRSPGDPGSYHLAPVQAVLGLP